MNRNTLAFESAVPEELDRQLRALDDLTLDGTCKGIAPRSTPFRFGEIGRRDWNVLNEDMAFPVAVIRQSAIDRNRNWMRGFLAYSGAQLAPHVKTSMSPHLFRMQLEDGAWALTAATANQVAVLRRFGVHRIVIANQVVGRENAALLFDELEREDGAEIFAVIDSHESLDTLLKAGRGKELKRKLGVLLEVGASGGRTGFRDINDARLLAQRIYEEKETIELRGIESYESVFPTLAETEKLSRIEAMLDAMLSLASDVRDAGWFAQKEIILSSGGSEYFDVVTRRLKSWQAAQGVVVLIRSGCYLAHDHLAYARAFDRLLTREPSLRHVAPGLEGALEVWGVVQSRPEPDLAVVTVGKRDISFDFELPTARLEYRAGRDLAPRVLEQPRPVTRLNDQHAFVRCDAHADLKIGDLIGFGISHPCTTFDKWQVIPVVDDNYNVISAVRTFF